MKLKIIATILYGSFLGIFQLHAQAPVAPIIEKLDTKMITAVKTKYRPEIIKYSADGKYFMILSYTDGLAKNMMIYLYDSNYKLVGSSNLLKIDTYSVQLLKSGKLVLSDNKTITVFNLTNLKVPIKTFKIPSNNFGVSADEKHLLTVTQDKAYGQVISDFSFLTGLLNSKDACPEGISPVGEILFGHDWDTKKSFAYIASMSSLVENRDSRIKNGFVKIDFDQKPLTVFYVKPYNYIQYGFVRTSAIDTLGGLPKIYFSFGNYITRYSSGIGEFDMRLTKKTYPDMHNSEAEICDLATTPNGQYLVASFAYSHQIIIWRANSDAENKFEYYKTINSNFNDNALISLTPNSKQIAVVGTGVVNIYKLE